MLECWKIVDSLKMSPVTHQISTEIYFKHNASVNKISFIYPSNNAGVDLLHQKLQRLSLNKIMLILFQRMFRMFVFQKCVKEK